MNTQFERDRAYLVAQHIVKSLYQKGMLTEKELVKIDAILAEKFSPSLAARRPKLACIH